MLASARAAATADPSAHSASSRRWHRPRSTWDRITPELPLAPMSEPWEMALHVATMSRSASATPSRAVTTDSRVRAMLVPVSPSGTG